MKHINTLAFNVLFTCILTLNLNAQVNKLKGGNFDAANSFELEIISYSDQPDFSLEHYHILSLKNTSSKQTSYNLSSEVTNYNEAYENVVENQHGKQDNNTAIDANKMNTKEEANSIEVSFVDGTKTKHLNTITLNPNETEKFYVKMKRVNNTEVGKTKFFKISAQNTGLNSKSVIIKNVIANQNNLGN